MLPWLMFRLGLKFEQNFQRNSNFIDLSKLRFLQGRCGQKSSIWAKFSTQLKFLDFTKIHVLQDWGGQKS